MVFWVATSRFGRVWDVWKRPRVQGLDKIRPQARKCWKIGVLPLMIYDFHVHDAIRVEYRVRTDGPSFPRGWSRIEEETRVAGGNGAVCAAALARWGAKVLLTGNALGDDAHGQFLVEQLGQIPNLTFESQIQPGLATPYAILIKAGQKGIGVMLSPTASALILTKRPKNSHLARFFWGDAGVWGDGHAELPPFSQDYGSLSTNLDGVAMVYLNMMAPGIEVEAREQFLKALEATYGERFGGLDSIPTLEELEAKLNAR